MNTWQPPQHHPVRPDSQNHVALGVLIALAVVGAALALLTALDRRDSRDETTLMAAVSELHDARIELQASAEDLRNATSTLQQAARTLERRATTVNILDVAPSMPPAPPTLPPTPPSSSGTICGGGDHSGIACSDVGHCTIARTELERLIANPASLATQARIMPSIKDGQPRGFKLYGIRPGSLPKLLGMHNGDLITAINGVPMLTLEHAMEVYARFHTARALELSISRKGEPVTLTLTIE